MEVSSARLFVILKGGGYLTTTITRAALDTFVGMLKDRRGWFQMTSTDDVIPVLMVDLSEVAGFYLLPDGKSPQERIAEAVEQEVKKHSEGDEWKGDDA